MINLYNRRCRVFTLCLLLSGCAVIPSGLHAQSGSSTLSGIVQDQTEKVIPNAKVVVRNDANGLVRSAELDSNGRFTVTGLAAGTYTVDISAPGFGTTSRTGVRLTSSASQEMVISLKVADIAQTVTIEASTSVAADLAPMKTSLDTRSAKSEISADFVKNFTSPVADYTEVTLMAPGTFSVSPNGVGLGDSKTYFRGFSDGQYTMTFDGIPFNDTNSPTHHSWAFFPSQWIGATDFDRSPGTASTIGPTNFGGSINLMSRDSAPDPNVRATGTYGSFNTRLLGLDFDSGDFGGKEKKSNVVIDIHQLLSDGYQTYNYQKRIGGSLKYQYRLTLKTTVTVFGGLLDLWTNTPNTKGPTRAQVAQFGDNYLLSGDPSRADYYGYNFYHVQTDFEYIGLNTELGHGWKLDTKAYTYRYWNKQNYNGTTITTTSGTDKLNGYRKLGDTIAMSHDSRFGTFRTGIWYEWAYTDRYQIPTDPRTWKNAILPNFHEQFITQSVQPYAEFEFHVTPKLSILAGVKLAYYNQNLNQFADNGKTVGNLGGVAFVSHTANYHSWLPSIDARYRLSRNWTAYAQFGEGSVIPPSSVFDVKNAKVAVLPNPTLVKTYQAGSVWKINRVTLNVDYYYSHFQNPYATTADPVTGEPVYFLTSPSNTQGFEAEGNVFIGRGLSLYLNGTAGTAKYAKTGLWVASAPKDTETAGVTYQHSNWDIAFFNKRIGKMYNDNGSINQAVAIDPFNITNVFFNYTVKNSSYLRGSKFRFSINNLLDKHSIVGVNPASSASNAPAGGDVLTLLAGRSFSVTITPAYSPKR